MAKYIIVCRSEDGTDYYDGFGYSSERADAKVFNSLDAAETVKKRLLDKAQQAEFWISLRIRKV